MIVNIIDIYSGYQVNPLDDDNYYIIVFVFQLIQYQEQSDVAFQLLVKSQLLAKPLDIDELMSYPLSPVPHCFGTPDGFFCKTNKAAMMHYLLEGNTDEVSYPTDAMFIQDGNALFHELTNLPPTFGATYLMMLDQMVAKKLFLFSTDSYQPDPKPWNIFAWEHLGNSSLMDQPPGCLRTSNYFFVMRKIRYSSLE